MEIRGLKNSCWKFGFMDGIRFFYCCFFLLWLFFLLQTLMFVSESIKNLKFHSVVSDNLPVLKNIVVFLKISVFVIW